MSKTNGMAKKIDLLVDAVKSVLPRHVLKH